MKKLLLLLFSPIAFASITDVGTQNIYHSYVQVVGVISSGCARVRLGTTSGVYTYITSNPQCGTTVLGIGIGTLNASTHYFGVIDRINALTDGGVAETSSEFEFTTTAAPSSLPNPPSIATSWDPLPDKPDVSTYPSIPIKCDAPNYYPVASANVSNPGGWASAISIGDDLQDIINIITPPALIEFIEEDDCFVNLQNMTFGTGYDLPFKTATGDWIFFRTHASSALNFPPDGVRMTPEWTKSAKLRVKTPAFALNPGFTGTGQVFQCYQVNCNHYWFENLDFVVNENYAASTETDPATYSCFFTVNPADDTHHPDHIVLNHIKMIVNTPQRSMCGVDSGGNNFALIDSYIGIDYWLPGLYPTVAPSVAGTVITIPANSRFKYNYNDSTSYGTTTATTINTAGTGTGDLVVWFDAVTPGVNGVTVSYTGTTVPSCGGGGCTIVNNVTLPDIPVNAFRYGYLSVTSGTPAWTYYVVDSHDISKWAVWKPLGIFLTSGTTHRYKNNYIRAHGQTVYSDPSYIDLNNFLWDKNYFNIPTSYMRNSTNWDGYVRWGRNPFETKLANVWHLEGNFFDGSFSYQNSGAAILLAPSFGFAPHGIESLGVNDILIDYNIFDHISSGIAILGGGAQGPPDGPTAKRIKIRQNILKDLDMDRHAFYDGAGPTLNAGYFEIPVGNVDVDINHNTALTDKGPGTFIIYYGEASNAQTILSTNLNISDNLFGMWHRAYTDQLYCHTSVAPYLNFPPSASQLVDCAASTQNNKMATFWKRTGTGSAFTYTGNYHIGMYNGPNGFVSNPVTYTEQNSTDVGNLVSGFPAGNFYPTDNTVAARLAAIGFSFSDYKATNCGGCGADPDLLWPKMGVVVDVNPGTPDNDSFTLTATAPDSKECYLETSTDVGFNNPAHMTRTGDGGGARSRTVTADSLTTGTLYYWRYLCYVNQLSGTSYPEVTNGSFTTGTSPPGIVGPVLSGGATLVGGQILQ